MITAARTPAPASAHEPATICAISLGTPAVGKALSLIVIGIVDLAPHDGPTPSTIHSLPCLPARPP